MSSELECPNLNKRPAEPLEHVFFSMGQIGFGFGLFLCFSLKQWIEQWVGDG